jgi:hypothetical protein
MLSGVSPGRSCSGHKAFDKLRRELTTMRLAVEKLADEPAKIIIPDYTATFEGTSKNRAFLIV